MKRIVGIVLFCSFALGLVGCSYLFSGEPDSVLLESDFDECPEWLTERPIVFVDDGALQLVAPDSVDSTTGVKLPVEVHNARLSLEFDIVDPVGSHFGVAFVFNSWSDGLYALWIRQAGGDGDYYSLNRYNQKLSPGTFVISAGKLTGGFMLSKSEAARLDIMDGGISLWLNGDLVCSIPGIGATALDGIIIFAYNATISIDHLRVEDLE